MGTIVKVDRQDILSIGDTTYNNDGFLSIITCGALFGIERILLRNILEDINPKYKIVNQEGYYYGDEADVCGWVFHTNMPWEEYEQIDKI